MTPEAARASFAGTRVVRLATVASDASPHLVPMVFALSGDTVYSAVDAKPKRSTALKRLSNVVANPAVALLADAYDEDWTQLWWARADGTGRVLEPGSPEAVRAVDLLVDRYRQYDDARPAGPVLAVDVHRWSGWSFTGD